MHVTYNTLQTAVERELDTTKASLASAKRELSGAKQQALLRQDSVQGNAVYYHTSYFNRQLCYYWCEHSPLHIILAQQQATAPLQGLQMPGRYRVTCHAVGDSPQRLLLCVNALYLTSNTLLERLCHAVFDHFLHAV
jgi:hypothetical protein